MCVERKPRIGTYRSRTMKCDMNDARIAERKLLLEELRYSGVALKLGKAI